MVDYILVLTEKYANLHYFILKETTELETPEIWSVLSTQNTSSGMQQLE